jgi:hypothetical protein
MHPGRLCTSSAIIAAMMILPPVAAAPSGTKAAVARSIQFTFPQFVAQAVSFKAVDETGLDWPGSDEVQLVFADFNPVQERVSVLFGNVDTGDVETFAADDNCIARQPSCDRGVSALHFGISLWERDASYLPFMDFCSGQLPNSHIYYNTGICGGDDLIGRMEIRHDQADLAAALPAVGDAAEFTVTPPGETGKYQVTYRVTRLADVQRTLVIHVPPGIVPMIALQAMTVQMAGAHYVDLTWTGAATATVDLFRNGTKLVTTANDGAYSDSVSIGSYQYRLCNLNSTTACSALVDITVP